ncbi:hypothetical protein V8E54_004450 [Elaphomyces granulatus]
MFSSKLPHMALEFLNHPPTTILSHELFPDPVVIHFIPFTLIPFTRRGLGRRPWVPCQQESLVFRTKFVPVRQLASHAMRTTLFRTFPSPNDGTMNTVSSDEVCTGTHLVHFRPSAPALPGIYQLQVSVFVCRPGTYNRGILVGRTGSYAIDVRPNHDDPRAPISTNFESAQSMRIPRKQ